MSGHLGRQSEDEPQNQKNHPKWFGESKRIEETFFHGMCPHSEMELPNVVLSRAYFRAGLKQRVRPEYSECPRSRFPPFPFLFRFPERRHSYRMCFILS